MKSLVIGTAGHIDHGKSSLIRALTGTDPDRLKEEKERGITIDLGFAHMNLGEVEIGFVDVPGHERFVRNMLAGAAGIDAVLFVVAADESVMPQTREHLDICNLLGIQRGIFVVTKIDAVDPELLPLVAEEMRETAAGTSLQDCPVVFASSQTGEGMEGLNQALLDLAHGTVARTGSQVARLPIDRVFTMHGFGTVVTGTLYSGQLRKEDPVEIFPGPVPARIRGLQSYGRTAEAATEGRRTAVNLQGIDKSRLARGMTLAPPGAMAPSTRLDATLEAVTSADRPLRHREVVRLHLGTQETLARVLLLGGECLEPGKSAAVQFRTQKPVCAWSGDRFIIRRVSPAATIGGGEIIVPAARKRRRSGDHESLERLAAKDGLDRVREWVLAERYAAEPDLTRQFGFPPQALQAALRGDAIAVVAGTPRWYVSMEFLRDLSQQAMDLLDRFHQERPLSLGIKKEEMRPRLYRGLPPEIAQHVTDALRTAGSLIYSGEFIALPGRGMALSPEEQKLLDALESRLESAGIQPPSIKELMHDFKGGDKQLRSLLFVLQQRNIGIKITEDLFIHRVHLERMRNELSRHFATGSRFNVAQFKDLLGISRKFAIPFLEYLDRQRITRRVGDLREVL